MPLDQAYVVKRERRTKGDSRVSVFAAGEMEVPLAGMSKTVREVGLCGGREKFIKNQKPV